MHIVNRLGTDFQVSLHEVPEPEDAEYWGFVYRALSDKGRVYEFRLVFYRAKFPSKAQARAFAQSKDIISALHTRLNNLTESGEPVLNIMGNPGEWQFLS